MTDQTAAAALAGDNGGAPAGTPTGAAPATPPSAQTPAPWYGQVDEQTAAYIQNKGWDNPNKLLESYRNLEKFAGGSKNLVEIPGADADDAAWNAYFDKIGRPGDPEAYGLNPAEGDDPDLVSWLKKTGHEYGLLPQQVKGVYEKWNEMARERMGSMEEMSRVESEKAIQSLKQEWGSSYDKNLTAGRQAAAALGFGQEELSTLESKLGTGDMLRLFTKLGSRMMEPGFAGDARSGNAGGFATTAAQAQAQLAELKTDTSFMKLYMEGDKGAVAKMTRLMEQAYASK